MLAGYLYFYNPVWLIVALIRDKTPVSRKPAYMQIIGMMGGVNLHAGDHHTLVRKLVRADADDAAMLGVDHRLLFEDCGCPQAVRCQGARRCDERGAARRV